MATAAGRPWRGLLRPRKADIPLGRRQAATSEIEWVPRSCNGLYKASIVSAFARLLGKRKLRCDDPERGPARGGHAGSAARLRFTGVKRRPARALGVTSR